MTYAQIILACLIAFGWSRVFMPSPNATVSITNARMESLCGFVGIISLVIAASTLFVWVLT